MAAGDDEKPKFRCLAAGRYAVAITVAVIVVVVIVHAVVTVLRPGDLTISLDEGYVSVKNVSKVSPATLCFTFTFRASNPSGRVRIYFTDILANISRSSLAVEDFFVCTVDDFVVGQQDASVVAVNAPSEDMPRDDFNQLFGGGSIGNAILKLSGNRTDETYAGHNDTKRVVYYCPSITVGGEDPEDGSPYVRCTEQQPVSG